MLFIPTEVLPSQATYIRVDKIDSPREAASSQAEDASSSLTVIGFSPDNDVIFEFKNNI